MYHAPDWIGGPCVFYIKHFKGGEYIPGKDIPDEDFDVKIPMEYIHSLVAFLEKEGYIRPTMSAESRDADLKIIHKLIDVIGKEK